MDDLLAEFIAETSETLEIISGEIVAWESDPENSDHIDAIFRFVHTVKGSCGFLDLSHLLRISHEAESALADVRDGKRKPTRHLVSTILAIIDRIGVIVEALERGEEIDENQDEPLIAALGEEHDGTDEYLNLAPGQPHRETRAPARSIRVPLELLDRLMGGVSDLVLARNELSRQLRWIEADDKVEQAFDRMSGCVAEMRDAITWARMQRIENLFAALPRLVRDVSAELGKSVALEIDGSDVELDREMIEMLRDPLTHIVRNALDHGIESADEREAEGKPGQGLLRVTARQSGNRIHIAITDDGRGIDGERLKHRALEGDFITLAEARTMSDSEALNLVFSPGFSTAKEVSAISGRGVGMDIVRSNVERIGGSIEIESAPGSGTKLSLFVPLTLSIIPALIFGVRAGRYAIPRSAIGEVVSLNADRASIETVAGADFAQIRGKRMPVVKLNGILRPETAAETEDAGFLVIVRSSRCERYAILVSSVFDHEELVVKPAAPGIIEAGIFIGTALPDNGLPLLLLNIEGLATIAGLHLRESRGLSQKTVTQVQQPEAPDALIFTDLDGCRRAIRMGLVEKIIEADVSQITERAGMLRLLHNEETLPVVVSSSLPETGKVGLMRLSDGQTAIAYAIAKGPADVAPLPHSFEPAARPGKVSGVAVLDGEPIELLDGHFLFAEFAGGRAAQALKPKCLVIGGDDLWHRELLVPLIELAGYTVTFDEQEDVAMVIDASEADHVQLPHDPDTVVRLTANPSPGSERLYRYDRTAIIDALHTHRKARA